jgi:hypothetical protein
MTCSSAAGGMATRWAAWSAPPLLLLLASGCERLLPPDCATEARPALSVAVRSATTGEAMAERAVVRVRDGTYEDTLPLCGRDADGRWLTRCGAAERVGTYRIDVTSAGYVPWQTGVLVQRDGCHVATVEVEAGLADPPVHLGATTAWIGSDLALTSTFFAPPDTLPRVFVGGNVTATRFTPPDTIRVTLPAERGTYPIAVGFPGRDAFWAGTVSVGGGYRSTFTIQPTGGAPLVWPGGGEPTFLITVDSGLAFVDPRVPSTTLILPDSQQDGWCVYGPGPVVGGGITTSGMQPGSTSACLPVVARVPGAKWPAVDTGPVAGGGDVRFVARLAPGHWLYSYHHTTYVQFRDEAGLWRLFGFQADEPKDVVISPRGDRAIVRGSNNSTGAAMLEPGKLEPVYYLSRYHYIRGAAFSPDGDTVFLLVDTGVYSGSPAVAAVRANDGSVLREVPVPYSADHLVLDQDRPWLYAIDGFSYCGDVMHASPSVRVLDRRTFATIALLPSSACVGIPGGSSVYGVLGASERQLFVLLSSPWSAPYVVPAPIVVFDLLP